MMHLRSTDTYLDELLEAIIGNTSESLVSSMLDTALEKMKMKGVNPHLMHRFILKMQHRIGSLNVSESELFTAAHLQYVVKKLEEIKKRINNGIDEETFLPENRRYT